MIDGIKTRKVGFFGGTFDPPHFGHVNLCISLMEAKELDEVIVCPCGIPPIKDHSQLKASPKQRLEMVELAFFNVPNITVLDFEVCKTSASYTVETLSHLKKNLDGDELYLLLGSDVARSFSLWKDPKSIMQLAKPLVATREKNSLNALESSYKDYFKDALIVTNQFDISSTELRNRLLNKKYCGHLIPAKVLDYIYSNQLYFS